MRALFSCCDHRAHPEKATSAKAIATRRIGRAPSVREISGGFPGCHPGPLVCVIHAESLLDSPYSWKRVMTCHWYPRLPLPPECMKPGTDDLPPCRAWASKEEATIEASFQSAWQQGGRSSGVSLAKRAIRLVPGRARLPQVLRVARVTANPLSPGHRASSYFASWKMIPSA